MTRRTEVPLRLLAILAGVGRQQPALLAAMQKEFGIADLAEHAERTVSPALADAALAWLHRRTGDRSLGLRLGLDCPINAGGALGAYLAACPKLLTALGEFQAWYPLQSWDGSHCRLLPHARGIALEITGFEVRSVADCLRVDLVLGRLLTLARRLGGETSRPQLIVYPESEFGVPPDLESHAAQVVLARNRLTLQFSEADAERPSACPNVMLVRVLRPELERELEQLARADSLARRIRGWLGAMPTLAQATQAAAAERFHLSESSVKRRLAEEGTSFSDLLQSYRRERALELLTEGDDKVEAIAHTLGFSERASFERAFRGWFDMTPSSYREQVRRLTGSEHGTELIDVERLPSSPRVCAQILELLNEDDYRIEELARLVNLDPALTARIMGIARSAFYGGRPVRSLTEAIGTVLGVDQVRYLALISGANAAFNSNLPAGFDLSRYWLEALLRADLVGALLRRGAPGFGPGAYAISLAALLLDIGRFMLAHMYPGRMADFLARSTGLADVAARSALERDVFGSSLRGAGALLMAHWNLPPEATRIVRELESPEGYAARAAETRLVGDVADFVSTLPAGAQDASHRSAFCNAVGATLGLDADAVERIIEAPLARLGDTEALVAQLLG